MRLTAFEFPIIFYFQPLGVNILAISIFELFSIGIGPSSSHTVGPMRAARRFIQELDTSALLKTTHRIKADLYGSLGQTGKGHGSDVAVLLGLQREQPSEIDPDTIPNKLSLIRDQQKIQLSEHHTIHFNEKSDLIFHRSETLPFHANGMKFSAISDNGTILLEKIYYSVGGGFVVNDGPDKNVPIIEDTTPLSHPFKTGDELLSLTKNTGLCISSIMLENEQAWRKKDDIEQQLLAIWQVMKNCIKRGCEREGILPGGLKVKRRAPELFKKLKARTTPASAGFSDMDWVNLYALAVNEENAAGGRVVTAPTNGAAGILPAVLSYYVNHLCHGKAEDRAIMNYLLTAAAIGILYKENASISGAEVGCQGEVGVACSMAAAALTEVLGGTPSQVENAAEIGMEHNLGLTCDPVGGLVQVPCIERNAMGSIKAINAARLALNGDGSHKVSLDKVIKTMRETGADMKTKYKETARGGLAVNIIEC